MSSVVKAAEKWLEKHPYLKDIAALSLACEKILEDCQVINDLPSDIDSVKEKYTQGASLLLTGLDFGVDKVAGNILLKLSALSEETELPEPVRENAKKIALLSEDESKSLVKAVIDGNADVFMQMVEKTGIKEDMLLYFVWVAVRKSISGITDKLNNWVSENLWQKGICPVCANPASNAFFKHTKRGRQKFLHCDHCGTEWVYKRIGCPYCENNDQKKMSIKDSQDEPNIRIDLCHKCNSYIKTYVGEDVSSAGKEGWASIHLDILMKESGFESKGSLIKP